MSVSLWFLMALAAGGTPRSSPIDAEPEFPGLPISTPPVGVDDKAFAPVNDLALADIERLVAEERARLQSNPVSGPAVTSGAVPPSIVDVTAGTTTSLDIGLSQLNRIAVPFADFNVLHQSTASVQKQGAAIYVSASEPLPFSVYIEECEVPNRTIGVLFRPVPGMPPVQVALAWSGVVSTLANDAGVGEHSANGADWDSRIRTLLEQVARDGHPDGMTQRSRTHGDPDVDCRIAGLFVKPTDVLVDREWMVLVGQAHNLGAMPVDVREDACVGPGVVAVATYPVQHVEPGQRTQVMWVVQTPAPASMPHRRVGP